MKEFFGYISKDNVSSILGYEMSLQKQGCRPLLLGYDDKKFYCIFKAENKPKGLGRNKEIKPGEFYIVPNRQSPEF